MYTPSLTIDNVIDALAVFLTPFIAPCPTVRGQVNRTPPPVTGFIVLTEMHRTPLETPTSTWDANDQQANLRTPTQIDVQVDFYGPAAGDQCSAITSVFRSEYTPAQFPDGIKPILCSDGQQSPLVTGEEQYEQRWTLTVSLQYNPLITLPLQTANTLATTVKPALN